MSTKAKLNYMIDVTIAFAFVLAAVSGLVLYFVPAGFQGGRNPYYGQTVLMLSTHAWDVVHTWSGIAMVAGVGAHLVLHWNWMVCMTRHILAGRRRQRLAPGRVCPAERDGLDPNGAAEPAPRRRAAPATRPRESRRIRRAAPATRPRAGYQPCSRPGGPVRARPRERVDVSRPPASLSPARRQAHAHRRAERDLAHPHLSVGNPGALGGGIGSVGAAELHPQREQWIGVRARRPGRALGELGH